MHVDDCFKFKPHRKLERYNRQNFVLNTIDYFQCYIILFEMMLCKYKLLLDDTENNYYIAKHAHNWKKFIVCDMRRALE